MWRGHAAIPLYLMAGYAYEVLDYPIIEDNDFDALCRHIQDNWESLKHHHRDWVDYDSLASSTCSHMTGEDTVPSRVIGALYTFIETDQEIKLLPVGVPAHA